MIWSWYKGLTVINSFLQKKNGVTVPLGNQATQPTTNATPIHSAKPSQWIFESGASHHITNDSENFHSFSDYGGPNEILIDDGSCLQITHTDTYTLSSVDKTFKLSTVLCVPSLNQNIVYVAKFCRTNYVFVEVFPFQFLFKNLITGVILFLDENQNEVY